ncbi:MAG: TolC family protein, partial [Ignavibacteria bacterium]|nr:TolC family protein [Ignavibacteria bacterium]
MKFFLVSILSLVITISVLPQTELSLDQAIRLAIQKNSNLISSENELSRSKSSLDAAYGRFLPDLNAFGSW